MVGVFSAEATIKIKHFGREELIQMENTHVFGNDGWQEKPSALWGEGKKNCKNSPRVSFWVRPTWVLVDGFVLLYLGTFRRPPSYRRHLHRNSGEPGRPSPEHWWMSGSLSWIWRCGFAKARQTSPCFAKVRMKARACFRYTLEFAWFTVPSNMITELSFSEFWICITVILISLPGEGFL